MGIRKEYWSNAETLSAQKVANLAIYNQSVIDYAFNTSNQTALSNTLNGISTLLSFISLIPGAQAAGVAGSIITGVSGLISGSEKTMVANVIKNGKTSLSNILIDMNANGWTDVVAVMPLLEFVDEKWIVVQGTCFVYCYKKNGSWVDINKNY